MEVSCCNRARNSTNLIIFIAFCSLLTDSLLLTLVDPILPDILLNIDIGRLNGSFNYSEGDVLSKTINANGRYGFLVALKGAAQFLVNPLVGSIVTRFGFRKPMLFGSLLLMASTIAFAFGSSYAMLAITRTTQGISSSFTAVTSMGLLASTFSDDSQRGRAMGLGIAGLSVGITVGPVYGAVLYDFCGQAMPFIVVASMVGLTTVAMLVSYKEDEETQDQSSKSILKLICDPYILVVAVMLFLLNLDVSIILAFLPMRLIDLQQPPTWQLGLVVLPTSIGYLVAGVIFSRTSKWLPRWLCAMCGLVVSTVSLGLLAFCVTFLQMLGVTTFLGIAVGMVSTSAQPIFAYLVDIRHASVYGNVYAISDMSVCLAMTIGPLVGGLVNFTIGFEWLVLSSAIMNIIFTPLCIMLRNPPAKIKRKDDKSPLIEKSSFSSGYQSKAFSSKENSFNLDTAYRNNYWLLSSAELFLKKGKQYEGKLYNSI